MTIGSTPARDLRLLWSICAGAFLLRLATGWLLPNINHPDETFQYLEQAYRLITDRGMVPWEYQVGARSWLLAWLITPVVAIAHAISPDPAILRGAVILFLSLLSTTIVPAAWRIGLHSGGRRAAILAALLAAVWCEVVLLSTHMLADSISAIPLMAALAAGIRGKEASIREIVLAGLLFGFAIVIRPQLAPACALAALWIAGIRPGPRWGMMIAGLAGPILSLGVTDWISWGAPFHSIATYLHVNAAGIADIFGTAPPYAYLTREAAMWGLALPLIAATGLLGIGRAPLVALLALTVVATFSAVPHKEWRFIYPALPLIFTLCGIGTARAIDWLSRRQPGGDPRRLVIIVGAFWLAVSAMIGAGATMRPYWLQNTSQIRALDLASADPKACGLGIAPSSYWTDTGHARIRADMRLLAATPADAPHFNYLMLTAGLTPPPAFAALGYDKAVCFPRGVCLYKRPGECRPSGRELTAPPGPEVSARLKALGVL